MKNIFEGGNRESNEEEGTPFLNIRLKKQEALDMIKNSEASLEEKRDSEGNLEWVKVFSNDGTLIYFEDLKGLKGKPKQGD